MHISTRQHQILADLGITVWQRRDEQPAWPAEENSIADTVPSDDIEINGALVVVMADIDLDEVKQRLLSAMLKSVGLALEQVTVLSRAQFDKQSVEEWQDIPMLMFGDTVSTEVAASSAYTCPDLQSMLQDPMLKASAWRTLKQLRTVF
jgi:DNA polymerase III psi subunit